jgi:beta-lactam-binding protein with PASTA domain
MSFEPGELIGGRYELGRQLGAGGMARVYLGHDRLLDRQVAVKVLSEPYASDPQFVERFRREASAAAGLNHPNIVAVYDRGEADGSYYIVMEYLKGPDLKQVIRSRAPLPALEAIDNAQQILAALGAAHRSDLVHRDVKPQNVLVAEDGHLKVTDFGIARAGAESDMTEAGSVIGTAQYLSPEQARGDDVTAASDCYAVGIVLYEMLTGRVPFDGGPPVAVAMKQITEAPVSPRIVEPGVPRELEAVVLRSLAKRPSERYRTAEEMSRALAEVRGVLDGSGGTTRVIPGAAGADTGSTRVIGPATGATRVGPPPPAEPPAPRRRWGPIIAGILVLLVVAGVGAAVLLNGGSGGKAVTIPRVAGLDATSAQLSLRDLKLKVDLRTVTDPSVTRGNAIDTDPPEGAKAHEGDTVILRISGGPGDATVPDVTNFEEAAATSALRRAKFQVGTTQEANDTVAQGLVIRTEPAALAQATVGSTVTLVLSSGAAQQPVPRVTGIGRAEAEATLTNRGFRVKVASRPTSDFPPGIVVDQNPPSGSTAPRGSAVTITVAVAPSNVPVPSVIGLTAAAAQTTLQNQGFRVTSDTADSPEPAGTVIDQEPPAQSSQPPGTRIVITVSNGPATTTAPSSQAPPPTSTTP